MKLIGLDLFSGIGGITKALEDWIVPYAYCENDPYAQAVLLSLMAKGDIPIAPIWDDVRTLKGSMLPQVDIIYGGFPCQDISVAGHGKGLDGKRSGLFFEIVRLAKEIKPTFLFLENVPAITSRGGTEVVNQITQMGYDCRWTCLSAAEVGANHKRERWWLLGYSKHNGLSSFSKLRSSHTPSNDSQKRSVEASQSERTDRSSNVSSLRRCESPFQWDDIEENGSNSNSSRRRPNAARYGISGESAKLQQTNRQTRSNNPETLCRSISDSDSKGLEGQREESCGITKEQPDFMHESWWSAKSDVGRVAYGIPFRVDRIRGLGNSVVPQCAKEAFKELMGIRS